MKIQYRYHDEGKSENNSFFYDFPNRCCRQCTNSFWQLPEGFVQGDAKKSTGINLQYLKGLKTNYLILRCLHSDSFHQMEDY